MTVMIGLIGISALALLVFYFYILMEGDNQK